MDNFAVGDKVLLVYCSAGPTGTVSGLWRGKVMVRLDDFPDACWVLRPSSLQLVAIDRKTLISRISHSRKGFSQ